MPSPFGPDRSKDTTSKVTSTPEIFSESLGGNNAATRDFNASKVILPPPSLTPHPRSVQGSALSFIRQAEAIEHCSTGMNYFDSPGGYLTYDLETAEELLGTEGGFLLVVDTEPAIFAVVTEEDASAIWGRTPGQLQDLESLYEFSEVVLSVNGLSALGGHPVTDERTPLTKEQLKGIKKALKAVGFKPCNDTDYEREPFGFGFDGNNRTERITVEFEQGVIYATAHHNQSGNAPEDEVDDDYCKTMVATADCADPIAFLDAWLVENRKVAPGIRVSTPPRLSGMSHRHPSQERTMTVIEVTHAGKVVSTNDEGKGVFTRNQDGTYRQHVGVNSTPTFKTAEQFGAWLQSKYPAF